RFAQSTSGFPRDEDSVGQEAWFFEVALADPNPAAGTWPPRGSRRTRSCDSRRSAPARIVVAVVCARPAGDRPAAGRRGRSRALTCCGLRRRSIRPAWLLRVAAELAGEGADRWQPRSTNLRRAS